MPRGVHVKVAQAVAVVATAMAFAACTNDHIVYRDRVLPTQPPAAGANFVGYSDTTTKATVCGSCHVDQQSAWVQTKHANAYADMKASGHSSASCEPCHTVGSYGNAGADSNVAWAATKDARYQDVQCESCHGAGLTHVSNPTLGNRPLASIDVPTDKTPTDGCGECHAGSHDPFYDEWKTSGHGLVPNQSHATSATCVTCHIGQNALTSIFKVNTNYVEANQTTNPMAITCVVCHDPHKAQNTAQLRAAVNSLDPKTNLCMQCHNRDSIASATSTHAPMTPETATLLGKAGWPQPTTPIVASHGSAGNTRACATCHVVNKTINGPKGTVYTTGHTFAAIPCSDSLGRPEADGECAVPERDFTACTGSGCHSTPAAAQSAYMTDSLRILSLQNTLSAMLKKVPASELNYSSTVLTTAKGATYNLWLSQKKGAWVHNPFLIETLLTSSITKVQTQYGIAPSANITLTNILGKAMR
ncbi:MAG TPA: cytochrome c3 family protein [Gemmatimonadaceae bacterium]|nr:cytochrome c3 family protein [Gemmatimonadaceae bacterium]